MIDVLETDDPNMLKTISWLLDKNFYVPAYQRGYRWTEKQVKDLLDDIHEFSQKENKEKDEFYCLQPLVVKKNGDKWNLIDGQQRLTTIVLIVKYFNEMWIRKQKLEFPQLEYETRKKSKEFLDSLEINDAGNVTSSQPSDENIDFHYMANAYKTIHNWAVGKGNDFDNSVFQSVFLHHTKIIWYETDESEDEKKSFIRINSGKIPLTNAELIKALFLQKKNFPDNTELSIHRYEMAEDWDRIEHKLQDDAFWFFLSKENPPAYSRIDFIFNLIYKDSTGKYADINEPLTTYIYFSQKASEPNWKVDEQWRQIRDVFDTICEWYEDNTLYHCIGYLIYSGKSISEIYKACKNVKKDEFFNSVKIMMKETLPCELNRIGELSYENDKGKLPKFFVLYNILHILTTNSFYRFPFDKLKNENWDIEHIDSQTENPLTKFNDQKEWLEYSLSDNSELLSDIKDKIENYVKLNKDEINQEEFNKLYRKIIEQVCDKDIDKDSIGNLTLLDCHTNRAYGNSLFPTKRRFIIEKDRQGTFIPPCTRNVFLKYYQENTVALRKWTNEDARAYEDNIIETITNFFSEVKDEQ